MEDNLAVEIRDVSKRFPGPGGQPEGIPELLPPLRMDLPGPLQRGAVIPGPRTPRLGSVRRDHLFHHDPPLRQLGHEAEVQV